MEVGGGVLSVMCTLYCMCQMRTRDKTHRQLKVLSEGHKGQTSIQLRKEINLCYSGDGSWDLSVQCVTLMNTVDREIFAVKIIHTLNFRTFNFRRLTAPQ